MSNSEWKRVNYVRCHAACVEWGAGEEPGYAFREAEAREEPDGRLRVRGVYRDESGTVYEALLPVGWVVSYA